MPPLRFSGMAAGEKGYSTHPSLWQCFPASPGEPWDEMGPNGICHPYSELWVCPGGFLSQSDLSLRGMAKRHPFQIPEPPSLAPFHSPRRSPVSTRHSLQRQSSPPSLSHPAKKTHFSLVCMQSHSSHHYWDGCKMRIGTSASLSMLHWSSVSPTLERNAVTFFLLYLDIKAWWVWIHQGSSPLSPPGTRMKSASRRCVKHLATEWQSLSKW